jgi:pantetheine-phosphate adenylyltransferase
MFSVGERTAMLEGETRAITKKRGGVVRVATFDNLAVEAAREHGASVIIRGLRDGTDFDYEMQMAGMNGEMEPEIQTVFLAASPGVRHIAANLVRQIALMGGDVSPFVSPAIARRLKTKASVKR